MYVSFVVKENIMNRWLIKSTTRSGSHLIYNLLVSSGLKGYHVTSNDNLFDKNSLWLNQIIIDEKLAQNARVLGEIFRSEMNKYIKSSKIVKLVRGKGLLNAIVINDSQDSQTAWNICLKLRDNGLLAKPTRGNVIRFAPPLVMTEDQLYDCVSIITSTIKEFE